MILTAAKSDAMTIEWNTLQDAIDLIENNETNMARAFTAVGRSDITIEVETVRAIVEKYGTISEKQLLHLVWRDMDAAKFDNVAATAERCGSIKKDIVNGQVVYKAIGDLK
jgi:hypothetical protein